jgi:hypothetical protein
MDTLYMRAITSPPTAVNTTTSQGGSFQRLREKDEGKILKFIPAPQFSLSHWPKTICCARTMILAMRRYQDIRLGSELLFPILSAQFYRFTAIGVWTRFRHKCSGVAE